MSFLTRKKYAWALVGRSVHCQFLTRKKWRDRATPLGANTDLSRGPVHPALGIFGVRKTSAPRASDSGAGTLVNGNGRGGMAMPERK
jgi:hypothetical protein